MRRRLTREIIPCLLIVIFIHTQVMAAFAETFEMPEEAETETTEAIEPVEVTETMEVTETQDSTEEAEEDMEKPETRVVDIFFNDINNAEIRVFRSPNNAVNQIFGSNKMVTIQDARAGDVFSYEVRKQGYYREQIAFVLSEKDIESGKKEITVERLKPCGGRGHEPYAVYRWPAEIEKLFTLSGLQGIDTGILDTPAFSKDKAAHEFTSNDELISYLEANKGENGYLFFLDELKTLPVVFFTTMDLSAEESAKTALNKLKQSKKLKILYQAQIHGNEPASGEAALTVAKRIGASGNTYLEKADIVIMPRVNYDGARAYLRSNNGIDLNRDALRQSSAVTKKLHSLYKELKPEVFIDGHEFSGKTQFARKKDGRNILKGLDDIQIICVNNLNRDSGCYTKEKAIVKNTMAELNRKGFRTFLYKPSADGTTSCGYARAQNSLTFLVESCGIALGKNHLERRVLSQHETVMKLIGESVEKADSLKKTVSSAKSNLISSGKNYSLKDTYVLKHRLSSKDAVAIKRPDYDYFGKIDGDADATDTYMNIGESAKKRSRPTAYIISKKSFYAPAVKQMLKEHDIKYFLTKKKKKISVRQYTGSGEKAFMSKKKNITFVDGAYVVYMNQEQANIISSLFEPDTANGDGNESLVQMGLIKRNSRKEFPLYRTETKEPLKTLKK